MYPWLNYPTHNSILWYDITTRTCTLIQGTHPAQISLAFKFCMCVWVCVCPDVLWNFTTGIKLCNYYQCQEVKHPVTTSILSIVSEQIDLLTSSPLQPPTITNLFSISSQFLKMYKRNHKSCKLFWTGW